MPKSTSDSASSSETKGKAKPKPPAGSRPEAAVQPVTEYKESRLLIDYGFELARHLGIGKVLVRAELLTDRKHVDRVRDRESLIWVTDNAKAFGRKGVRKIDHTVELPGSQVGRMDQVALALILSVLEGAIEEDESVVCLTGIAGSRRIDNLLIANPKRDFSWFAEHSLHRDGQLLVSREFVRLIEIALRFAAEGREGKPIGATLVLGDPKKLAPLTRPLILNPCEGHRRRSRSIHDQAFIESMREFAALDGAFIIDPTGVVERVGVYLDAPATRKVHVQKGLGSRHLAAAAITARTDAVAIVISESSGNVTVFSAGRAVVSLGRPSKA